MGRLIASSHTAEQRSERSERKGQEVRRRAEALNTLDRGEGDGRAEEGGPQGLGNGGPPFSRLGLGRPDPHRYPLDGGRTVPTSTPTPFPSSSPSKT